MSVDNFLEDDNTLPGSLGAKLFDRLCNVMGLISIIVCMFLPLYLIYNYAEELQGEKGRKMAQAGVGVAVLLRATSRRLIRTGASNVMRTTFATFFRATSRTFTRKMVRIVVHSMFGVIAKEAISTVRDEVSDQKEGVEEKLQAPLYALLLGFVALAFSFLGVLFVVSEKSANDALQGGELSILEASLAAAIPVLLFGIFTYIYSRRFGVKVKYNTAIDGLVLQAYFTAAGSFLPMTTDVDYVGDKKKKMKAATATLISMFTTHLLLGVFGYFLESPLLNFTSALFLVYCFIYSFPIRPLEGHDVWAQSKIFWVLIWLPILASFTLNETMKTLTDLL